ncbi:MAG: phenylalanine--tRNA ligase beta subunit-related protein [Planctomycetota bacterium]
MLEIHEHPKLDCRYFSTEFPAPLGELPTEQLGRLLSLKADPPFSSSDEIRKQIRDMLRVDGFKPTGRSKPAAEYLLKAEEKGQLGSINLAVDACNVASMHSGLPISVVDLDLLQGDNLKIAAAEAGSSYVFNRSGQEIEISGLLCLFDELGPCANAVKDSQRTKTADESKRTLSIIWGSKEQPGRAEKVEAWYRELLTNCGANCS